MPINLQKRKAGHRLEEQQQERDSDAGQFRRKGETKIVANSLQTKNSEKSNKLRRKPNIHNAKNSWYNGEEGEAKTQ